MPQDRRPIADCKHYYQNDGLCILNTVAIYPFLEINPKYYRMILDTGAAKVCISEDAFDELGIEKISDFIQRTGSGPYKGRLGIVEMITVAIQETRTPTSTEVQLVRVKNVEVATISNRILSTSGGILGMSFLSRVGMYIEPARQKLRFHYEELL